MIYLDNAATSLHKPPQVIEAAVQAMQEMGNGGRGGHTTALQSLRSIHRTRSKLAALFGCSRPDHVIFTCNATEALNIALNGLLAPGDHVITTDLEHNSVLRPLYHLEKMGVIELSFVPADEQGRIQPEQFRDYFKPSTKLVVCTHASNVTGNCLAIDRIGQISKEKGALFVVDASQTAGCIPIQMEEMGIDVLCFTGHKGLMAPQGTGGLCIRPGVEVEPLKRGGSGVHSFEQDQPREYPTRLEAGTLNGHGIAGLGAAVDVIQSIGLSTIFQHEQALMRQFYDGVCNLPGVQVYGDFFQPQRAAVVSLSIEGVDSSAVSDELEQVYGIATRPGAHCAPRMHQALGTVESGLVRFSFGWYNTPEQVEQAIHAVKSIVTNA